MSAEPVTIAGVPESISLTKLAAMLRTIGIDPEHVRDFSFDANRGLSAEVYALDPQGRRQVASLGNLEAATHRIFIRLTDHEETGS